MAIARAQGANGHNLDGSTSTISTAAMGSTTTAGNSIVVGIVINGAIVSTSVTDTAGNTYRRLTYAKHDFVFAEIWIAQNIKAVASNVVTANTDFRDGAIFAEEWSGLATNCLDRVVSANTGFSTALATGNSAIPQYHNELVFVVGEIDLSGTTNLTVGGGFSNFTTDRSNAIVGAIESKVISSAAAQNGTMTADNSAVSWVILTATLSDTSIRPSFRSNNLRPHPFSPGLAR